MTRLWKATVASLLAIVLLSAVGTGTAGATLAFTRNPFHPAVFAAQDNGKGVHRIGVGTSPHVSPDGLSVAYFRESKGQNPELALAPAAGGPTRILMHGWQERFYFAYSPDSRLIAVERGHEFGKDKLVVIEVASGRQQVVANGYFHGFSFSPDSTELAFAKTGLEASATGDVFRIPVTGGTPVAITHNHRSTEPLWGPTDEIVFDRTRGLNAEYGPKADLYLMNSDGSGVRRLTHTKIISLTFGLTAIDWSADGRHLLAEFGGQDTSFAVTVDPLTGAERKVIPGRFSEGFVGGALSSDGTLVLGSNGGEEPGPHNVAVVPYSGGKEKVVIRNGYEADWSR